MLTPKGAILLKEIGVDGLLDSLSTLSAYVFPRVLEIYSLPSQVRLQIFSDRSTLMYEPYSYRCTHSGSCP